MIEVQNISKTFGEKRVLSDIDIVFEKGKTNLVIGKSGSGKTVLLKSLVGLLEVDEGKILFDNRNFTSMNFKQRKALRKEFGMLFQGAALFDSFTVEENVMYPMDMFTDMSFTDKVKRTEFCLDRVDMGKTGPLYPAELSGGMRKRVGIARAIALNPQYLFCDEPNSGLDPQTAIRIDKLIREITAEFNITTIVNTHDMNSVMEIGEKVIFIFEGIKCWEGTRNDILHAKNKSLNDFVFATNLTRKLREIQIQK